MLFTSFSASFFKVNLSQSGFINLIAETHLVLTCLIIHESEIENVPSQATFFRNFFNLRVDKFMIICISFEIKESNVVTDTPDTKTVPVNTRDLFANAACLNKRRNEKPHDKYCHVAVNN